MTNGLSIDIDGSSVRSLKDAFEASDAQIIAAMRSTYAGMARWLRTKGVRGLSANLGVQQKILRSRVRSFRLQGGVSRNCDGAKIWFGLRSIPLIRLNARELRGGVSASGGRYIEGAFIASFRGSRQVLKREGKPRIPVQVVSADITDASTVYIEDELIGTAEFDAQFFKLLEHELRWRTRILN